VRGSAIGPIAAVRLTRQNFIKADLLAQDGVAVQIYAARLFLVTLVSSIVGADAGVFTTHVISEKDRRSCENS